MTAHYEEVEKVITEKKLIKVTCDKCGKEIVRESADDFLSFTLDFSIGKQYRDGGYGNGWHVKDLCSTCANFLKDLLIENGFDIKEYDW